MKKLSVAEARAYASKILNRLREEGFFDLTCSPSAVAQQVTGVVAEELQEIFGQEED